MKIKKSVIEVDGFILNNKIWIGKMAIYIFTIVNFLQIFKSKLSNWIKPFLIKGSSDFLLINN